MPSAHPGALIALVIVAWISSYALFRDVYRAFRAVDGPWGWTATPPRDWIEYGIWVGPYGRQGEPTYVVGCESLGDIVVIWQAFADSSVFADQSVHIERLRE